MPITPLEQSIVLTDASGNLVGTIPITSDNQNPTNLASPNALLVESIVGLLNNNGFFDRLRESAVLPGAIVDQAPGVERLLGQIVILLRALLLSTIDQNQILGRGLLSSISAATAGKADTMMLADLIQQATVDPNTGLGVASDPTTLQ